jgi:hypothetical protein
MLIMHLLKKEGDVPRPGETTAGTRAAYHHAYPVVCVELFLSLVLTAATSLRGAGWAMEVSARVLGLAAAGVPPRVMGIGGAVGVSTAANVFVGMVEAPLFIRPYLASLTRSELFSVMTCGMATVAGTVMALYAAILGKLNLGLDVPGVALGEDWMLVVMNAIGLGTLRHGIQKSGL